MSTHEVTPDHRVAASNGNGNGNGRYAAVGEVPDDVVRVLRGAPDEDELAALVAGIVAARASGAHQEVDDGSATSLWNNHGHRLGLPPSTARAAWRWSARAPH
ncbi:MAG TPA: acyl-CoA carboxylase subunit epsilon [Beutenbergiaceae bacterium]|nr:acyl-CoA carboxylase subunit epsilon [Beutenbergiaceae bacterium]